jgi:hypothetical protein
MINIPTCMHAGTDDGGGNIHKAKLNGNGTFSVGKTWPVSELTGIEVITVRILNLAAASHAHVEHSLLSGPFHSRGRTNGRATTRAPNLHSPLPWPGYTVRSTVASASFGSLASTKVKTCSSSMMYANNSPP